MWFEISRAIISPIIVIMRAVSLISVGIVICSGFVGKIVVEISRPASRVPMASRRIGLISALVFSLMLVRAL